MSGDNRSRDWREDHQQSASTRQADSGGLSGQFTHDWIPANTALVQTGEEYETSGPNWGVIGLALLQQQQQQQRPTPSTPAQQQEYDPWVEDWWPNGVETTMEGLNLDQVCYLSKHTDTQQEGWVKCYQVVFGANGADKVERYDAPAFSSAVRPAKPFVARPSVRAVFSPMPVERMDYSIYMHWGNSEYRKREEKEAAEAASRK